jgi:hypothetical protein
MSSANCPHGFPPADCLICRTLGTQPTAQVEGARRPAAGTGGTAGRAPRPDRRGRGPDQPDAVYPPRTSGERARSLSSHAALVVVSVAVLAVLAWFLAGAVFAFLRVLELLVVAGLAGWVGYRLGHYRGRHSGP